MKLLLLLIFLFATCFAVYKSSIYGAKAKETSNPEAIENEKKHDAWVIVGMILIIPTVIALVVYLLDFVD
jgi:heme/copper-type cytochrome/quinol oxidase subunit 2